MRAAKGFGCAGGTWAKPCRRDRDVETRKVLGAWELVLGASGTRGHAGIPAVTRSPGGEELQDNPAIGD